MAFRYGRDIRAGEIVRAEDIIMVQIRKGFAECIGNLLTLEDSDIIAVDKRIYRDVSKDEFVTTKHFERPNDLRPDYDTPEGEVQITIRVDPEKTSGTVLRIGYHVNILGMLPTKEGAYKTYRIIEWLKVVAIGGHTGRTDSLGGSATTAKRGARPYKTITVEVQRKDPDVSLQWSNLQTYLQGPATIEICPGRFRPKRGTAGRIAPELIQFTTKAATVSAEISGD